MSHKIGGTKERDLIRGLKHFGYEGPHRGTRKHPYMTRESDGFVLHVPNGHGKTHGEYCEEVVRDVLGKAGISLDDWISLMHPTKAGKRRRAQTSLKTDHMDNEIMPE